MKIDRETADKYQGLFNYLNDQYGINPTVEGMNDLIAEVEKTKQLLIPLVVSSAMYKATFSFKKYSPRGGDGYWTTEIVPIQAKDETELKEKIATHLKDDNCGYHKHIRLKDIELM